MPSFDVAGARLFYEIAGSGRPAIVLVHGGMCDHRDWASQLRDLSGDHAVLAFDLRGHGQSTGDFATCHVERHAADIHALVDALGLAPVVLAGHSLGARIVAEAAWQRPENIAALILLDGSRSHGGFAASQAAAAPPPMQASLEDILNATIGPHAGDATRKHVLATMAAAPSALMAACVAAMRDWDLGRADTVYPGLRPDMPILAIQSTYHDQFTPRRSLEHESESTPYLDYLRSACPNLDVVILPHTGHFSMMEKPGAVTALIRDFANRTRGG